MSRRALIIGDGGQDGAYLKAHLAADAWQVTGLSRTNLTLPGAQAIERRFSLTDEEAVAELIALSKPDRIFYLAAHHASSDLRDIEDPLVTFDLSMATNFAGVANVLKAIVRGGGEQRLCYAASSHVFGAPDSAPQSEGTPFRPNSAYSVSKVAAIETCRLFRHRHGVFVSTAILYNHESPRRRGEFVTQMVATAAAQISCGLSKGLELRDVWATTDWGAAEDYVRAMAMMLDIETPDDFIVASGLRRSIADFAAIAFSHVGLDWRDHVHSRTEPPQAPAAGGLVGDSSKLQAMTGWRPAISFEAMVRQMVDAALARCVRP